MKTRIVIETVDELFKLFNNVRHEGDKFPYVGTDKVHLMLEINDRKGFCFRLQGEDAEKYCLDLNTSDEFKDVMVRAFAKCGILLEVD